MSAERDSIVGTMPVPGRSLESRQGRPAFLDYSTLPLTPWTTTPSRRGKRPWTAPTTETVGYLCGGGRRPKTTVMRRRRVGNYVEPVPRWNLPSLSANQRRLYTINWACLEGEGRHFLIDRHRIRESTDQQIVSYLRKQLNKRTEERLQRLRRDASSTTQTSSSEEKARHSAKSGPTQTNFQHLTEKYDANGNRIDGDESKDCEDPLVLPSILNKADGTPKKRKSVTIGSMPRRDGTPSHSRQGSGRSSAAELEALGSSDSDQEQDFHSLAISPVPTPLIYRPRTREESRLSLDQMVDAIVQGSLTVRPPTDGNIVRIYIGSAFGDSDHERGYLIPSMYREVKTYCRLRNYELQIFDLHWGVKDWVTDDHSAPDTALKLLETCVEGARTLAFVTFMSQKYGAAVLPSFIPKDEFDILSLAITHEYSKQRLLALENKVQKRRSQVPEDDTELLIEKRADTINLLPADRRPSKIQLILKRRESQFRDIAEKLATDSFDPNLLRSWYVLDNNVVPPVYRLQKISTYIPDILRNDPSKRQQAKNAWSTTSQRLCRMLQGIVNRLNDERIDERRYFCSVPDLEVEYALLMSHRPDQHVVWYQRDIVDIHSHLNSMAAKDYVDLLPLDPEIDPEVAKRLEEVRGKLQEKLPVGNVHQFEVNWSKDGITPDSRDHVTYMGKLSRDLKQTIIRNINALMTEDSKRNSKKMTVYQEVTPHVHFCQERSRMFHGRKDLLSTVKRYLVSKCRSPLVLYGRSGSGKTSLMAKIAKDAKKWFNGQSLSCIVRMIGVTSESTNIRLLLRSICLQLVIIQGGDCDDVPQDYRALMNDLPYRLSKTTADRQVVIIIDSLNQLTDDNDARQLAWLPKELPKHVKMIVSTLPDEKHNTFPRLKSIYSKEDYFLQVPQMHEGDAIIMLDHWLKTGRRTLTQFQYDTLIGTFKKCPLPLFLKISYDESMEWTSYMPEEKVRLQTTIKSAILVLFSRLESTHGEPLVRRALGYVAASRHGITENEMEDLLSLDDAVMDDLNAQFKLPYRRCPQICWMRLRSDLKDYLVERTADGCSPLCWFQSQFQEAAEERYLNQKDKAPSYHKALAEYFMDLWKDGKPIGQTDTPVDRYVLEQPTFFTVTVNEKSTRVYNLRKMSELPYHLIKASMFPHLKKQTLCNFEWLLAKTTAMSIISVLNDFHVALTVEPDDPDLKVLSHAVHLSSSVLANDPTQLSTQLVGRLQDIITADKPTAPQDPLKLPYLHPLLRQAKNTDLASLIPSVTCLAPPDGTLFDLLSGHKQPITALTNTTDGLRGVTASKDNTAKVWDLKSGKVMQTLRGVGQDVLMLRTALNNTFLITSETSRIRVWNLGTEECIRSIDDYVDPASITIAQDGKLLVAYYDGAFYMRSWSLASEINLVNEVDLRMYSGGFHQDQSITVSYNAYGDQVLAAFRGSSSGLLHNAITGNLVYELTTPSPGSAVTAVAMSRDYFILACRYLHMNLHELFQLELFDNASGKYIRGVRGCTADDCRALIINQIGSHALSVCASEQNRSSTIAVWNLETEEHKHLAHHSSVSTMCACLDLRYILTASNDENSMRIWNLRGVNQTVSKLTERTGIKSVYVMGENSHYAVAESFESGTIFVTNLKRNNYCGEIVMKERRLVGKQDVILFREHMAVILADRVVSTVTEDNQQVYQTVYLYNLITKKYERKIKDCFIYPSPAHEYRVLSDYRLMGLSENRSHFIIWNTINGHIIYRIKPNFRAVQRELGVMSELGLSIKTSETALPLNRSSTVMMTPWDRRAETTTARQRRKREEIELERQKAEEIKREKENAIDQFILSKDERVIVASFYAHHICIFDVETQKHTGTLEDEHSMLLLYGASLTRTGSHLVLCNYDEKAKTSYVTLWDCKTCQVKKRLKNERNVYVTAVTDTANRIVFGKENSEIRIWDPTREKSLRKVKSYKGLNFGVDSRIHLIDDGAKAAVFAGDISLWDLEKAEIISVFTPDMRIQSFELAMNGELLVFGLRDTERVIALRLSKKHRNEIKNRTKEIFGEKGQSSDEEDEEDA